MVELVCHFGNVAYRDCCRDITLIDILYLCVRQKSTESGICKIKGIREMLYRHKHRDALGFIVKTAMGARMLRNMIEQPLIHKDDIEARLDAVYLRIRKIIAGYQTELEASQEQEKKARQEKDELMRNMAHDLRTPLTGVMTYVDVMKLENEAYAENMKNLNFISEKVLDIRTQVDNLLDFSIAGSQRPVELDASMDVEYIFGDYLSDVCAQLMKSNYEVDAEGISFKQVKVAVNMAFLTRIFSNLTDNIYKYADNKKPVVMKTAFTKKTFSVEIGNGVCDNKTLLKSAGIGLKSVDAMMQRMNGSMSFKREHGKFWVKLEFPIV